MVTHYKADRAQVNIENIQIDTGNFQGYGSAGYGDTGTDATGTSSEPDYDKMFK
jgi:hypothetical protein